MMIWVNHQKLEEQVRKLPGIETNRDPCQVVVEVCQKFGNNGIQIHEFSPAIKEAWEMRDTPREAAMLILALYKDRKGIAAYGDANSGESPRVE